MVVLKLVWNAPILEQEIQLGPAFAFLIRCPVLYVGWVGVVWQRRCKMRQSLPERDNQGTVFCFVFCFLAVAMAGGRVVNRSFVRNGEPQLRTRGMIVSPGVIVCLW